MSRVMSPEGSTPYVYNPRNGRVMIATQEKLDRLDDNGKPYFIPWETLEGPVKTVKVSTGSDISGPVIGDVPNAEATKLEVKGGDDLLKIVMASEDKDELVQIAVDLGMDSVKKTMKIATMQSKIAHKLSEMNIL